MSTLVAIAAVFALAGLVKGVVGLGLPTLSIALLASLMTPTEAAALLIVPSLVTNVRQMGRWDALGPMLKRLGPMQAGVVGGTFFGAWLLGPPAGAWAMVSLGAALIAYAAWGLAGAHADVRPATEAWLGPVIGAVTGGVTAATGVFVVPAVPYLQALQLSRDDLVRAMGLSFTVSTVALAIALGLNGRYAGATLGLSFLMLVPALVGMAVGERLRHRLSPKLFRRCVLGGLVLLGVHMVANALPGR